MIYKIFGNKVHDAIRNGAEFIIFSSDGSYALVKSETSLDSALDVYDNHNLSELYNDSLYQQPCKDC